MKILKILFVVGKNENKIDIFCFGDELCFAIFNNANYLPNLKKLLLGGNKE